MCFTGLSTSGVLIYSVAVARVGILVAGIILVGKMMGVQAACVRGGVGYDR